MVRAAMISILCAACGRIDFDPRGATGDAVVADATLIGWWKFDDGAGGSAVDSSGQGNTGTLSPGITWVAGELSGAILDDGLADRDVDLGDPPVLRLTSSMSVAAWVNAISFNAGQNDDAIIGRDNVVFGEAGWALKGTEDCGPEMFAIQVAMTAVVTDKAQRCSVTVVTAGVWYHVAGVYDADAQTLDIYVNGVLDDGMLQGTVPTSQYVSTVDVEIGNTSPATPPIGGFNPFHGIIDDVRIYDGVLSAAQISALAML